MNHARERFHAHGANILAVAHAPPSVVASFLQREQLAIPLVTDPDRTLYRALQLRRVSFWHFLKPRVVWGFIRLLVRGEKLRRMTWKEDVYQLGGDFIVDHDRRVVQAFASDDATDRPSIDGLLMAIMQ